MISNDVYDQFTKHKDAEFTDGILRRLENWPIMYDNYNHIRVIMELDNFKWDAAGIDKMMKKYDITFDRIANEYCTKNGLIKTQYNYEVMRESFDFIINTLLREHGYTSPTPDIT